MERRVFLKGAGAVSIIVGGGGVWRAYDRGVFSVGEGSAFEPWKDWQQSKDSPLALVRAAILAASPHNTQPWLFRVADSNIDLYLDPKRYPGALDPYLREEHIGMGCALENLMLAAPANGYMASAKLFPAKLKAASAYADPELVASVALAPGPKQQSELYSAIPRRHTNRNPYDMKSLPADFIEEIRQIAGGETDVKMFVFTAVEDRNRLVEMISKANDIVYADPQINQGSESWIRGDWKDVQRSPDGLNLDQFGGSAGVIALRKFLPIQADNFASKHKLLPKASYTELLNATPLFGIIAVHDRYDREQCLSAGRTWQRAHLIATSRRIAARPVNEPVELIDHQRLHNQEPGAMATLVNFIGDQSWQPTFMFRFGYPIREVGPSPRRPVQDCLL